ncbi:MAG: hypothetical protein N3E44_02460, partial [Candidatus Bathyarchaeota archaeon]|nr:hypothetical protein [Candidatus Bathyarchaeota archaeon]
MKKRLIPLLNITVNSVVRAFLISKPLAVGTFLFLSIILTGIIGSRLLPFNPMHIGRFPVAKPPSFTNILGTDYLGRDVLGQLIISIENSIQIGLIAGLVGTSIGLLIGFT